MRGAFWMELFASVAFALVGCVGRNTPVLASAPLRTDNPHFVVIGDLQRTLFWERLVGREDNDAERRQLLPEVARENPAFVVVVGDLVSWGASTAQWNEFDERAAPLRNVGIPVLAVPGNHDYFGGGKLHLYFARLPGLEGRHWYERSYGPLAMLFLDSNAKPMGERAWKKQQEWYERALTRLEQDDDVYGVLVFLHHAPFTNSSSVGDDADVDRTFVPPFMRSSKTMAMVTGHAHGYERFETTSGKSFIVTGGGGGPRRPLLSGAKRRHPYDWFPGPPLRDFNFVDFSVEPYGLRARVVGLPKGQTEFCKMEAFDVPWARHGNPPAISEPSPIDSLPECFLH